MKREKTLLISFRQPKKYKISFAEWTSRLIKTAPLPKELSREIFKIIGEALNRIKYTDNELLEKISEHHRIIGFRNILIHGYDIVDEAIVWLAATKHLPILVGEINEILSA